MCVSLLCVSLFVCVHARASVCLLMILLAEVEIIQWFVKVGDKIQAFDRVCEVQSDKATVEISSRYDGEVVKVYTEVGGIAYVGQPLIDLRKPGTTSSPATAPQAAQESSAATGDVQGSFQESPVCTCQEIHRFRVYATIPGRARGGEGLPTPPRFPRSADFHSTQTPFPFFSRTQILGRAKPRTPSVCISVCQIRNRFQYSYMDPKSVLMHRKDV